MAKQKQSSGVMSEQQIKDDVAGAVKATGKFLTPEEQNQMSLVLTRIRSAQSQRAQPREEFDGLTYEQDYILNRQMCNTYLRPKKNDDEVRVNVGTPEKKIETLYNEIQNLNLTSEVQAYDEDDNEVSELGKDFQDIDFRTSQIEKDQGVWDDALFELLTQRCLFMEEVFEERTVNGKKKQLFKKRMLGGQQVYLGDVSIPARNFQTQPYIVKYNRLNWDIANTLFSKFPRWKTIMPTNGQELGDTEFKWRMFTTGSQMLKDNQVEIVIYESALDNEYQVIVNGMPLLEVGEKLPWKHEGYNTTMTIVKRMAEDYAYGKSPLSSAKTIGALNNETIRLLVRKFRQGVEPPLGVKKKGKIFGKDIWAPAAVTQGVGKNDFTKLIDHDGITASEHKFWETLQGITTEFIGASNLDQGLGEDKNQTLGETQIQRAQSVKNLFLPIAAMIKARSDMTMLRIFNVIENGATPIGKEMLGEEIASKFRRFTVQDAEFENGLTGKKVIEFSDRDLNDDELLQIRDEEKRLERIGKPTRFKSINAKKLKDIVLNWFVTVNPKEKAGSAVDKVINRDMTAEAVVISQITGKPLNADKLINNFERVWQVKDLFQTSAPGQAGEGGGVEGEANELLDKIGDLKQSKTAQDIKPKPNQKPSVNTLGAPA